MRETSRLARFAWFTLAYNVAVILWGAYVRATGSGAGCGSHWPLCNGEVIPRTPSIETLIEYSHRLTSGVALVLVVLLWWWTRRVLARPHPARGAAIAALILMLTEAAVGAGLVLFQLVADNASMARALFMAVHLINTFLLLAALTLTAHWASDGRPIRRPLHPGAIVALGSGALLLLLVGTSGAIAALGDTLYPTASLAEAVAADLSTTSHLLIRLRVLHPAIALGAALALAAMVARRRSAVDARGRQASTAVLVLVGLQVINGFANVFLLAPVWLQMVHLLVADLVWISFVIVGASVLAAPRVTAMSGEAARATTV